MNDPSNHPTVTLSWSPSGKPGFIQAVARFLDTTTFTHVVNVMNAVSREKYLDRLCEGREGIDRGEVAAELEKIAAALASEQPSSRDASGFAKQREDLLRQADEKCAAELNAMPEEAREAAEAMLVDPRLIDLIVADIAQMGVVGEQTLGAQTYVCATSRLLCKPISAVVQALTSTGKSFVPGRVGLLIPEEAKLVATDITTNALYYLPPGSLQHKFVLAGERRRGNNDDHAEATRALREMIESAELYKVVPVRSANGKMESKVIWQPGPIAYIDSTTNTALFEEDANRCLLLATDETAEQTARIVVSQGEAAERGPPDLTSLIQRHHAMQRTLKRVGVRIPYAGAIARAIPPQRPSARRAMPHTLSMIQAVALLHQQQRSDAVLEHGDLIDATVADYVVARRLLVSPLGRALGGALPSAATRFAHRLREQFGDRVFSSTEALVSDPVLDHKSKINTYLNALGNAGVADCVEPAKGQKPAQWKLVGDIPEVGAEWLPSLDALEGFR